MIEQDGDEVRCQRSIIQHRHPFIEWARPPQPSGELLSWPGSCLCLSQLSLVSAPLFRFSPPSSPLAAASVSLSMPLMTPAAQPWAVSSVPFVL